MISLARDTAPALLILLVAIAGALRDWRRDMNTTTPDAHRGPSHTSGGVNTAAATDRA